MMIAFDIGIFIAALVLYSWILWLCARTYYFHYFYETLKGKGMLEDWKTREVLKDDNK